MKIWLVLFSVLLANALTSTARAQAMLSEMQLRSLSEQAYIYAYPLVTMEMTRRVMTNVAAKDGMHAPVGQFANLRTYPDAGFKEVTAPNSDTLYSAAWLDLSQDAYVLSVPNENGRYYLMPLLNAWTTVFADPGTRTTGTDAQKFLITGPNWVGSVPKGVKQLSAATNTVWVLGRTYSSGTTADLKVVHELQDQLTLTPLSSYGTSFIPVPGKVDATIDMKTPVREQVNGMDGLSYFKMFAQLLKENPPVKADSPMLATLAKIGIVPGQSFNGSAFIAAGPHVLVGIPERAQRKIAGYADHALVARNGWTYFRETGSYGTNYLNRAVITAFGLGANLPQDAVYPVAKVDGTGAALTGANRYVLHLRKEQLPPVHGFWSLTMYDEQYFFVKNPLNRYNRSSRDPLKFNKDGSLDLLVQKEAPANAQLSNWLPAPESKFVLMMRLYWPMKSVLDGSWRMPAVKRLGRGLAGK